MSPKINKEQIIEYNFSNYSDLFKKKKYKIYILMISIILFIQMFNFKYGNYQ